MDLALWEKKYGERSLIESIESSNYDIFTRLLDAGTDVNQYDHIQDKSDEPPLLPIHVAAAIPDSRFLRDLIQRGADADDDRQDPRSCSQNEQAFDNTFRAAVRAGAWENVKTVVDHGGVNGGFDYGDMWEVRDAALRDSISVLEDDELTEDALKDTKHLFAMSWEALLQLPPPRDQVPRTQQRLWNTVSFTSNDDSDDDSLREWTNLDWIISTRLPHLDNARRQSIIDDLLLGGADYSCYTAENHTEMWNKRAALIADNSKASTDHHDSPIRSLGPSYHAVFTPLHTCVLRKDIPLLSHLITRWHFNPLIPEFSPRAYTPLFLALSRLDLETSDALLEVGGSDQLLFISPIMHTTILHIAADTRSADVLRWALDKLNSLDAVKAEEIFSKSSWLGHTPLHVACLPPFVDSAHPSDPDESSLRPSYATNSPGAVGRRESLAAFVELVISAGNGRWHWDDKDHFGVSARHYWKFSSMSMLKDGP